MFQRVNGRDAGDFPLRDHGDVRLATAAVAFDEYPIARFVYPEGRAGDRRRKSKRDKLGFVPTLLGTL